MSAAELHVVRPENRAPQKRVIRYRSNPHYEAIVAVVADHFGVLVEDVLGKERTKTVVRARDVALRAAERRYGYSSTELAAFAGRNCGSVSTALQRADAAIAADPAIGELVRRVCATAEGTVTG